MENNKHEKIIGKIFFNSYKIMEKIGEGSFGKVYIASDIRTKEFYAVKLVSKI
jgi:serine/threonine protein kinase